MQATARKIRGKLVEMSHKMGVPHLGGSLSCVDILVAAYWNVLHFDPAKPADMGRDRFILSKGHAATSLYATLAFRGFFDEELLDSFAQPGSPLAEHPLPNCAPGVEAATGSLGHGLPMGLGMALASRILKIPYRVFVLMSDGECNEGSVWEAALFAPMNRLENVVVIIDYNKWQATGRSNEVMSLAPLRIKWESFGWRTAEIDGHDIPALIREMSTPPDGTGRPLAIIANTVKGKGVSFMEDDNNWHYKSPSEAEAAAAQKELGLS